MVLTNVVARNLGNVLVDRSHLRHSKPYTTKMRSPPIAYNLGIDEKSQRWNLGHYRTLHRAHILCEGILLSLPGNPELAPTILLPGTWAVDD